jgi:hypothetical protein
VEYASLGGGLVHILHHPLQFIQFMMQLLALPAALQHIYDPTGCLSSIFQFIHDLLQNLGPLVVTLGRRCFSMAQFAKDGLALYVPALLLQPLQGVALHPVPQIPKAPPLPLHSSHINVGGSFVLIGCIGYMRILAAMCLLRVRRALRTESRNGIGF